MVQPAIDGANSPTLRLPGMILGMVLALAATVAARGELVWAMVLSPNNERPPGLDQPEPLIRTARDLLRLYGMDEKRLAGFDDAKLSENDRYELLLRWMIAVRRYSLVPADLQRYARSEPLAEFLKSSQNPRGELFRVRGKVRHVTAEKPDAHLAERFDLPVFYRCEVELEGGAPAVIHALNVPAPWRERESETPIDERIGAMAFFAGWPSGSDKNQPALVTARLAWHQATVLGDAGGDAGLFEGVENNTPLQEGDSACFYDMLSACDRVLTGQMIRSAVPDFKVASLFPRRDKKTKKVVDPPTPRGELIALTGTAQRAVRVQIEDPGTIAAYGFDHYFEVELWHGDAQGNPIVFCLRRLPKDMPVGERIAVDITVAGFFFKTWAYRINRPGEDDDKTRFQIAPLLIGREPVLAPREPESPWAAATAGSLFAVAVVGAWIGVVWSQREDKRFHDRVIRRVVSEGAEQPSLDGLASLELGAREFHDYANEAPLLPPGQEEDLPKIDTRGESPPSAETP